MMTTMTAVTMTTTDRRIRLTVENRLTIAVTLLSVLALTIVGLVLYHRRPQLAKKIVRMGLPEPLAEEWQGAFPEGFALSLVTVPADLFDAAQEEFLEDPNLMAPQAIDRRPVV